MTKQEMRSEMAMRVKNLSPTYCQEADTAICLRVTQSTLYQEARTILCYVGTAREINTMPLIHAALRDGKTLVLPFCTGEAGIMEARKIEGLSDLVSGRHGILAPKLQCPVVAPEQIDLALIPCCTGNADGQRLGYGGGYYDRYLPQTHCARMLLCRHQLVREDIPMEEHDVSMNYLVTERGITPCPHDLVEA